MKRQTTTLIAGLAGILVWSFLLLLAAAHLRDGTPDEISPPEMAETADAAEPLPRENPGETKPAVERHAEVAMPALTELRPVRPVEPEAFDFPLARDTSSFERIDARQPLPGSVQTAAAAVQLARPGTINAGRLAFGQRSLQLTGVIPTDHTRRCTGPDGKEWPCGVAARTALRLFLRNRTIGCDLPSSQWAGTVTAECRLGDKSIGAWLVENGWAEAEPASPLAALGEAAKAARRGIYGNDTRQAARAPAKDPTP